ncbi:HAD hydrolase-like protein [Nocardiopsis sp. EMB25]|uniref:HAD family hydrolase n=1 Tax=Nocardiopsis TaxID=2013 RepID=UPI0003670B3C|nr:MULTISPECIES: HAD family hydrolase [Nocardiopsis]MCY9783434.1 HAD hydrolase-like protein [Nocardiopsis sp. EMB25]
METGRSAGVPLDRVRGAVLDTDGVVADTGFVHAAAWKRVFDSFLRDLSRAGGGGFRPFDMREDYLRYLGGRSRADGVRAFLASRGVHLPEEPVPPDRTETVTVGWLVDREDRRFLDFVDRYGVTAFSGTVEFVGGLRSAGVPVAAVASGRDRAGVLRAAGVADLFDVRVDGADAIRLGLSGDPGPALLLEAVRRMGTEPRRAAAAEDTPTGVEDARRGGFGLVVGVDRTGAREEMLDRGAHVVVSDLAMLLPGARAR